MSIDVNSDLQETYFADLGVEVTFRQRTSASFTASTGQQSPTYTDHTVDAVKGAATVQQMRELGPPVEVGGTFFDFRAAQLGVEPSQGDVIKESDGTEHEVTVPESLSKATLLKARGALYRVFVRRK